MRFLITGGAGFIGSTAARRLSELGHEVVVFDNFSRAAVPFNRRWLEKVSPAVTFAVGDVRSADDLREALRDPLDAVLHLAGQVAVTTSITDPVADYESNVLGTFRLLAAVRARYARRPEEAPLGDQRVFYCDISQARRDLGWEPRVDPDAGVGRLLDWIGEDREETATFLTRKGISVAAE